MDWPLHEAPERKFVAIFDELRAERAKATNLRTLREAAGLSQSQLAKASGWACAPSSYTRSGRRTSTRPRA